MASFLIFISIFLIFPSTPAFSSDTSATETEVADSVIRVHLLCSEPGKLRVDLVNEETFGDPDRPLRRQEIIIKKEELSQHMAITFQGIKPGRYALRAFIDRNADGRLNRGLFGPTEPWALSWAALPKHGIPRFKDVAFHVVNGITNIQMELRK